MTNNDEKYYMDYFGMTPEQIPEYKRLILLPSKEWPEELRKQATADLISAGYLTIVSKGIIVQGQGHVVPVPNFQLDMMPPDYWNNVIAGWVAAHPLSKESEIAP